MVTTRIQTTRRRLGSSRHPHQSRRRRAAWPLPLLATIAGGATKRRPGLSHAARLYGAGAALLVIVIAYLVVSAQATQTSYELDRLKDQNTRLTAEQDQLRYDDARMHTNAGVAQAAAATGLQHNNPARYAGYQPVALDLGAPIGPDQPADTPGWQRALAFLAGGGIHDAQAAGR